MYILQNHKLYILDGDNLIGVNIDSNGVTKVEGTDIKLEGIYEVCTPVEVRCKFHLDTDSYVFPIGEKVVGNDSTSDIKKPVRTRTRK